VIAPCRSVPPEPLRKIGRGELIDQIAKLQHVVEPLRHVATCKSDGQAVAPRLIFVDEVGGRLNRLSPPLRTAAAIGEAREMISMESPFTGRLLETQWPATFANWG
jgi:hypothetical protein